MNPDLRSNELSGLIPNSSLDEPAMRNQGVVGRVLTRHVGLKPDLRPNGLSGDYLGLMFPACNADRTVDISCRQRAILQQHLFLTYYVARAVNVKLA